MTPQGKKRSQGLCAYASCQKRSVMFMCYDHTKMKNTLSRKNRKARRAICKLKPNGALKC